MSYPKILYFLFSDKPTLKYFNSPFRESTLAAHVPCLSHSCCLKSFIRKNKENKIKKRPWSQQKIFAVDI